MEMKEGSCTSTSKEDVPWLWHPSFPFELGPYVFFPEFFLGNGPRKLAGFFGGSGFSPKTPIVTPDANAFVNMQLCHAP
jgi:hypothetical protein